LRLSEQLFVTRRDDPADAAVASHALLVRAGMLHRVAAGVYAHGPLLCLVIRRIETIVREETGRIGGQELLLSALQPRDLWERSGRWRRDVNVDRLMFTTRDRSGAEFGLGPTHEEAMTDLVAGQVSSYRQLPVLLYQLQTKFRDEPRPRFGLLRAREFHMKDAYSFDRDEEGMRSSYERVGAAYEKVFARCGLDTLRVDADPGAMGGSASAEFIAVADVGEDVLAVCERTGYAANVEVARAHIPNPAAPDLDRPMSRVSTPRARTIAEVREFILDVPVGRFVKTLLYRVRDEGGDEQVVAALVRGDRAVNETKLANLLGAAEVELADAGTVRAVTGVEPGFAGPVGLPSDVRIVGDLSLNGVDLFVCGANEPDAHLRDVRFGRDVDLPDLADIDLVQDGDLTPDGAGRLRIVRGIELGHIFQLGTRYAERLGASYLANDGQEHPMWMGSYGIGITRLAAAIVEQHHDERGCRWPASVAPHAVVIVQTRAGAEDQDRLAATLYDRLRTAGTPVAWDDRDERPGVKLHDADLVGWPWRIVVGRDAAGGQVEVTARSGGDAVVMSLAEAVDHIGGAGAHDETHDMPHCRDRGSTGHHG
jgi:prolyl-tRNA synthetase